MRSSHSLKTEERTQTVISGVAIVFQSNRFQKFRGGGVNGEISTLPPPRALSGDVTGGSRGSTTFMATCSSIVMQTYLCEYAQVTKEDLSPKLATLFPVRFSNIFCKCCVNDELEKGAPFEF